MSDSTVVATKPLTASKEFLSQYGVLGMKWGVRKDRSTLSKRENKKLDKADAKWERKVTTNEAYFAVYNEMAEKMNRFGIDQLNNDPRYKDKAPLDNPKLADQYMRDYSNMATNFLNEAANRKYGENASGTLRLRFSYDVSKDDFPEWWIENRDGENVVKHADDEIPFEIQATYKDGLITSFKVVDTSLKHDGLEKLTPGQEFLSQYGVLGMKWGVRKDRNGSRRKPSSEDHDNARKTKKRPTRTLTNAEIRRANERLQLERQFSQLKRDQATLTRGHNLIKAGLAITSTATSVYMFTQSPLGKKLQGIGSEYLKKLRENLA